MQILPDTLILCFSPCLGYGLNELYEKLPDNCLILGCETDSELYDFSINYLHENNLIPEKSFLFFNQKKLLELPLNITKFGFYKRTISIDFSAGVSFFSSFYQNLFTATRDAIAQFWKNRVTLVKFGRRYSANLFKNLSSIHRSSALPISEKPVLVVGAGESALPCLKTFFSNKNPDDFTIFCVDAAVNLLKLLKIKIDFAVCEESQAIIARCFSGKKENIKNYLCSTSSLPAISRINLSHTVFYASEYCSSSFFTNLIDKKLLPVVIPPLGSVGLSAVELALLMRKNENIPVFVCGLDFSYTKGNTHCKGTFHSISKASQTNKLSGIQNFYSCFSEQANKIVSQSGQEIYTTPSLYNYARLFAYKYANTPLLYNLSRNGINLEISYFNPENMVVTEKSSSVTNKTYLPSNQEIKDYFLEEIQKLTELKEIFTGAKIISENEKSSCIEQLLSNREYLYLHFPDGYKYSLKQDFLNRVRIEIDYFLKIFNSSLKNL